MKKYLIGLLILVGVISITSLFGASALENTMLIEQLKKDKSLQDKVKADYQKTKLSNDTTDKNYKLKILDSNTTVQKLYKNSKDLNTTDDSNETNKTQNSKQKYTLKNYYKNFTPFFYEDQISLVEEIEKRQIILKDGTALERFGIKFFKNSSNEIPTSGVPDDYVLSTGDSLKISVYGLSEYDGELEINKDGKIIIPQVGALSIRGLKYKIAKATIFNKLSSTYPNTTINITIGNTSPFAVSVVGEVNKPGLYTVNALSKVKNALFMAGGISNIGSMRDIQIKRNGRVVATFDLYDLLRGGRDNGDVYLYPGDVIYVPTATKQVFLDGNVKSPAIYELQNNETLQDLIRFAGGLNSDSTKTVKIFRSEKGVRTLFEAKLNEKVILHDGDKVMAGKISDVTDNLVYLYGNVYKNESISIDKRDTVGSLFKKLVNFYGTDKVFMSNTDMGYFVVKRVDEKTLEHKILSGNLLEAINGNKKFDVELQSEDKIFVFNKSITQDIKYIAVGGEVLRGGKFKYFDGMKLIDGIMAAGIKKESDLTKIKVTSVRSDNTYDIKYYNYDVANNITLNPYDDINITNFAINNDFEEITINGSVITGGTFNYSKDLTLNELINMAGGLKQNANKEQFELVSYKVENGVRTHDVKILNLKESLASNLKLNPFDEVMIRQVAQWGDQKTIILKGEVNYPGEYTIMPGEKLSSVLKRAGGLKASAFVEGSVFTRLDIQKIQQEAFQKQLNDLESSMMYLSTQPDEAGKSTNSAELLQVLDSVRKRGEATKMIGRLSIRLSRNINEFANSQYDIVLKGGDTLTIPEIEQSVAIMGEVMNNTAVTHIDGSDIWDYLEQAGGLKESGDQDGIFIVKANGEAKRLKKHFLIGYSNSKVEAGDTIVVPFKVDRFSGLKFAKDITSIIYQIAVSAAALKTVGAL